MVQDFAVQGRRAERAEHQHREVGGKQVRAVAVGPAGGAAEHGLQVQERAGEVGRREEHPAAHDEQHGQKVADRRGDAFQPVAQHEFFEDEQHAVEQAPEDEVPGGAVPEAGQQPDDQQVEDDPRCLPPVAAERDVHIVPEPGGQGDVPPAPEVGDRRGDVRVVEVLVEREPEHAAEADGHVRVPGKVEVDLQRVAGDAGPRGQRTEGPDVHRLDARVHGAERIRQHQLFGKADDEAGHSAGVFVPALFASGQLSLDVPVLDDGARDELREQRDVQCEGQEDLLDADLAGVQVDDVREDLERVERDADRQRQFERRDVRAEDAVHVVDEEVRVLEEAEDPEVEDDRENELGGRRLVPSAVPGVVDDPAGREVEQDAEEHQQDIDRLAPCVEHEAGAEQYAVFDRDVLRQRHADPVVEEQRERQERHQEGRGTEYHIVLSFGE